MNPKDEIDLLLKQDKARCVRQKTHKVWKLSNGAIFVIASTPQDTRADRNALARLKTLLGFHEKGRGQPGQRRKRKPVIESLAARVVAVTGLPNDVDFEALMDAQGVKRLKNR